MMIFYLVCFIFFYFIFSAPILFSLCFPSSSSLFCCSFSSLYQVQQKSFYIHIPFTYGAQLQPTLCNPLYCSLPGSSVHGIFQARILKWVAISSSRGSSQPRDQTYVSCMTGRFFTAEPLGKPPIYIYIQKLFYYT